MKSSGFNIEDTHMRDMERIARLVAMVCVALVWAYLVGEHKDINIKPIRVLKHGRKAKSLVKYGLEEISTILLRPTYTPKFDVFKFLSCTRYFLNNSGRKVRTKVNPLKHGRDYDKPMSYRQ